MAQLIVTLCTDFAYMPKVLNVSTLHMYFTFINNANGQNIIT